jgi:hypothetical protein
MTNSVIMPYTYVTAWRVVGGVNLSPNLDPQTLHRSDRCAFVLTTNPDKYLEKIDLRSAIGTATLNALLITGMGLNADTEIEKAIKEIRFARQRAGGTDTVLIAEGYGKAPVAMKHSANKNGYVVVLDGVDMTAVKNAHAEELESMKFALGFEGNSPANFAKIAEGIYLTDPDGRTVYSLNFSLTAHATVSTGLSAEGIRNISSRFLAIQKAPALSSIKRLYSRMAEHESDPLKGFLFGWSALEILIAKSFSSYEQDFMSPLLEGPQVGLREKFLRRVREVMKDKYRLSDKFNCASSVLFAEVSEVDVHADADRFERIKRVRDRILHGDDFSDRELPVGELAALLRKYVIAYLHLNSATSEDSHASPPHGR